MGREKIEMKKIENVSCRQVTFSKRCSGLFNKAMNFLCFAMLELVLSSSQTPPPLRVLQFQHEGNNQLIQMQVEMVQEQDELEVLINEVARLQSENEDIDYKFQALVNSPEGGEHLCYDLEVAHTDVQILMLALLCGGIVEE